MILEDTSVLSALMRTTRIRLSCRGSTNNPATRPHLDCRLRNPDGHRTNGPEVDVERSSRTSPLDSLADDLKGRVHDFDREAAPAAQTLAAHEQPVGRTAGSGMYKALGSPCHVAPRWAPATPSLRSSRCQS